MSGKIKIGFVGDLMLGDWLFSRGIGINRVLSMNGAEYFFHGMKDLLNDSELLVGNLEGTVANNTGKLKKPLSVNEKFIPVLKKTGFDFLSVANNHFADGGIEGIEFTLKILAENGIKALGLKDLSNTPVTAKDKEINIIAADILPNHHVRKPYPVPPPIITGSLSIIGEWICQVIERSDADYNIVYLHWGEEFMPYPDPYQVEWAHRFIDSGAIAVIGTHPHVPQPVERYKSGIIAYSLGNFISDMVYPPTKKGYMLRLFLKENEPVDYEIVAYKINKSYVPEILKDDEKQEFINEIINLPESVFSINDRRNRMDLYRIKAVEEENSMWKWAKSFYFRNFFRYPLSVHLEMLKNKLKRS